MVLKFIIEARLRGLAVIFISHNIHHAYPVGDVFTLLSRGQNRGTYRKLEISRDEIMEIMSGGEDLKALEAEIDELLAAIAAAPARAATARSPKDRPADQAAAARKRLLACRGGQPATAREWTMAIAPMRRDYSLIGRDAEAAVANGLAAAEWYKSEIPRKRMKELMRRTDGPALRDTAIWFALLFAFGAGGYVFWGTRWAVPFFFAYGVVYGSSSDSRWHEWATAPPSGRTGSTTRSIRSPAS